MEKRYQALRVIGVVFKVLGALIALLTVLGAVALCAGSMAGGGLARTFLNSQSLGLPGAMLGGAMESAMSVASAVVGLALALYGAFMAITLYAIGELIGVMLALEENTRATAALLHQHLTPPASTP